MMPGHEYGTESGRQRDCTAPASEHQRYVMRLARGVALALLLMNDLEQWPKRLPVHDAVQSGQWITQLLQLGQPIFVVKEAWLHPLRPLSVQLLPFCPNRGIIRDALTLNMVLKVPTEALETSN